MARSGLPRALPAWLETNARILGIRVGLNRGYETTAIPKRVKPSHLKGRLSKNTQFVRSVVREVVGFAPYERRVLELLRNSKVSTLLSPTYRPIYAHSLRLLRTG
jgi:large subunit ribosomal protein L36e